MNPDVSPYDALLLLSFGGPEKPEDVVPFLENVTRGRGIPRERLEEVGEHYFLFGGRSPINDQNRALLAAIREDLAGQRHRPAGLLGQPQLGPVPRRHARADDGRRRHRGPRSSPRRRTPRARRAGSTARTSPTRSPRSRGRPAPRQAAAVLQPPRLRGAGRRRLASPRSPSCPTPSARGPHLVFVTHSIPIAMADASGRRGGRRRLRRAAPQRRRRGGRPGPRGDRAGPPHALVYCSRSGRARRCRGSSPTSTTTSRRCQRRRAQRGDGADRLRLRPHGGHLRPRHRGDGHRRAARHARGACRDRRGPTRASWRWSATWCWSAPLSSAARTPVRAGGRLDAGLVRTSARRAAAPTREVRARRSAGRLVTSPAPTPGGPARPGAARSPTRARAWRVPDASRRDRRRRHQDQRRRRGHRGRPGGRGADPPRAPRAASRRRDPGRGGRRPPGHLGRALGRRPDRRHRELPLRPARLRRVGRGGGRRRRWSRASCVTSRPASSTPPRSGDGADPRRRSRSAVRPSPPAGRAAGRSPASATSARCASTRRGCVAALLPEVRDIRRMGSCALDLCHVADGSVDGYVEAGPQAWDCSAGRPRAERGRRPLRAARRPFALGSHRCATWWWAPRPTGGTSSSQRSPQAGFLA